MRLMQVEVWPLSILFNEWFVRVVLDFVVRI